MGPGAMAPVGALLVGLLWFQLCVNTVAHKPDESSGLCDIVLNVGSGYPCENYTVTTEDGFLLGLHRIPYGRNGERKHGSPTRPPVLLQHGLLQGGDTWLLNPTDQSLGYILADAGFDVWLGNTRGTRWSYGHVSIIKGDKDFWDWSWDELAAYDLPAMVEFVYLSTGRKVFYVGHSQGTIIGLAAFTQDKVGDFVAAAALLSPISYLNHITSSFINVAAKYHIDNMVKSMGVHEFNIRNQIGIELLNRVCVSERVDCGNLLTALTGPNCCFNDSRVPYYLRFEPHSTSLKNLGHLAQMIRKGTFCKYDYGTLGNLIHYYSFSPPAYDLGQIPTTLPIWMSWGGADALADKADVAHTMAELRSTPEVVYMEDYGHMDFILSTRGKRDIYDSMIAFFRAQTGVTQE